MDPRDGPPEGVVEYLSTGVLLLDDDLTVLYLNPVAEQLLGRSRQQVVGQSLVEGLPVLSSLEPLLRTAP